MQSISKEILKSCLKLWDGMPFNIPENKQAPRQFIAMTVWIPFHQYSYSINNDIICFVTKQNVYSSPVTAKLLKELKENGFKEDHFYTPFSYGDFPKREERKWNSILEDATKNNTWIHSLPEIQISEEIFKQKCKLYSEQIGLGFLSEREMKKCILLPNRNLEIKHSIINIHYYPILNHEYFNKIATLYIGKYNINKGTLIFIYRDGNTYLSKNLTLAKRLEAIGFKRTDFFVPFTNGEQITDKDFARRWKYLKK